MMDLFIIGAVLLVTSIGIVAYSLYRREEQIEIIKNKMTAAQEKFTNR